MFGDGQSYAAALNDDPLVTADVEQLMDAGNRHDGQQRRSTVEKQLPTNLGLSSIVITLLTFLNNVQRP